MGSFILEKCKFLNSWGHRDDRGMTMCSGYWVLMNRKSWKDDFMSCCSLDVDCPPV
jgi:hypothetical protein